MKKRWFTGAALAVAILLVGLYAWRWQRFDTKWQNLRPGMSAEAVRSLLGTPTDDRKVVDILGEQTTKLSWEYARGPYVYEVRLEYDEAQRKPSAVFDSFRRYREGREWISLRLR